MSVYIFMLIYNKTVINMTSINLEKKYNIVV